MDLDADPEPPQHVKCSRVSARPGFPSRRNNRRPPAYRWTHRGINTLLTYIDDPEQADNQRTLADLVASTLDPKGGA
jgi:hypothetical protein